MDVHVLRPECMADRTYPSPIFFFFLRWAAAFIMDITYGLKGEEAEPYLPMGMAAVKSMGIGGTPGAFYVDQIPICEYRPNPYIGEAWMS